MEPPFAVAVNMKVVVPATTGALMAWAPVVLEPAGIVNVSSGVAVAVEVRVTTVPPAGALRSNVIVAVSDPPLATLAVLNVRLAGTGSGTVTVSGCVLVLPFAVAETVKVVVAPTVGAVIACAPVVLEPAGMVNVSKGVADAVEVTVTTVPPAGAGISRVTVAVNEPPLAALDVLSVRLAGTGSGTVTVNG